MATIRDLLTDEEAQRLAQEGGFGALDKRLLSTNKTYNSLPPEQRLEVIERYFPGLHASSMIKAQQPQDTGLLSDSAKNWIKENGRVAAQTVGGTLGTLAGTAAGLAGGPIAALTVPGGAMAGGAIGTWTGDQLWNVVEGVTGLAPNKAFLDNIHDFARGGQTAIESELLGRGVQKVLPYMTAPLKMWATHQATPSGLAELAGSTPSLGRERIMEIGSLTRQAAAKDLGITLRAGQLTGVGSQNSLLSGFAGMPSAVDAVQQPFITQMNAINHRFGMVRDLIGAGLPIDAREIQRLGLEAKGVVDQYIGVAYPTANAAIQKTLRREIVDSFGWGMNDTFLSGNVQGLVGEMKKANRVWNNALYATERKLAGDGPNFSLQPVQDFAKDVLDGRSGKYSGIDIAPKVRSFIESVAGDDLALKDITPEMKKLIENTRAGGKSVEIGGVPLASGKVTLDELDSMRNFVHAETDAHISAKLMASGGKYVTSSDPTSHILKGLDDAIYESKILYGQTNPEYLAAATEARDGYRKFKTTFDIPTIADMMSSKTGHDAYMHLLDSADDQKIREITRAMGVGKNDRGTDLWNQSLGAWASREMMDQPVSGAKTFAPERLINKLTDETGLGFNAKSIAMFEHDLSRLKGLRFSLEMSKPIAEVSRKVNLAAENGTRWTSDLLGGDSSKIKEMLQPLGGSSAEDLAYSIPSKVPLTVTRLSAFDQITDGGLATPGTSAMRLKNVGAEGLNEIFGTNVTKHLKPVMDLAGSLGMVDNVARGTGPAGYLSRAEASHVANPEIPLGIMSGDLEKTGSSLKALASWPYHYAAAKAIDPAAANAAREVVGGYYGGGPAIKDILQMPAAKLGTLPNGPALNLRQGVQDLLGVRATSPGVLDTEAGSGAAIAKLLYRLKENDRGETPATAWLNQ